jgi:hypothetical protein
MTAVYATERCFRAAGYAGLRTGLASAAAIGGSGNVGVLEQK